MENFNEKPKLVLRGFYIPVEVQLNPDLDLPSAKPLFALIQMLDHSEQHCFASNEFLALVLNLKERQISASLSALIELGYVEVLSFDGRKRVMKIADNISEKFEKVRKRVDYIITNRRLPNEPSNSENNDSERVARQCYADPHEAAPKETSRQTSTEFNKGSTAVRGSSAVDCEHNKDIINNQYSYPSSKDYCENSHPADASVSHPKNKIIIRKTQAEQIREAAKNIPDPEETNPPKKKLIRKHTIASKRFCDYWESLGYPVPASDSKSFAEGIIFISKLLDGTMFNKVTTFSEELKPYRYHKFTEEEIYLGIQNFHLQVTSPEYYPTDPLKKEKLSKIPFGKFLWDSFLNYSQFLHSLVNLRKVQKKQILIRNIQKEHDNGNCHIYPKLLAFFRMIKERDPELYEKNALLQVSNNLFMFFQDEVSTSQYADYDKYKNFGSGTIYDATINHLINWWLKELQKYPPAEKSKHFEANWMLTNKNVRSVFPISKLRIE